ncbi:hypothetical protein [Variovorax sp. CF079]|uniref:hypothetical protein n=1 Tax=Variovorax sp. CF079 TaxID=1882774 RepID=UPI0014817A8E|nr:hypothetical protein [Variovorax sp. CF079]
MDERHDPFLGNLADRQQRSPLDRFIELLDARRKQRTIEIPVFLSVGNALGQEEVKGVQAESDLAVRILILNAHEALAPPDGQLRGALESTPWA